MEIPVAPPDRLRTQPLLWLYPAVGRPMMMYQRAFCLTLFALALLTFICSASFGDTTPATPAVSTAKKSTAPAKTSAKKKSAPAAKTVAHTPAPKTAAKPAVTTAKTQPPTAKTKSASTIHRAAPVKQAGVKPAVATARPAVIPASRTTTRRRPKVWVQTWDEPTFKDSTDGDSVEGEDLEVRRAAVDALGPYNGSIVVVDPNNGRILTMVNQHLALSGGYQPCSTIKVSVALAALHEGVLKQNRADSADLPPLSRPDPGHCAF